MLTATHTIPLLKKVAWASPYGGIPKKIAPFWEQEVEVDKSRCGGRFQAGGMQEERLFGEGTKFFDFLIADCRRNYKDTHGVKRFKKNITQEITRKLFSNREELTSNQLIIEVARWHSADVESKC